MGSPWLMSRFEVSPAELEGAAGTLGAVEAGFGCPSPATGELGSPELEGAISVFYQTADELALAMAQAVGQASIKATAAAEQYARTDAQAISEGG